EAKLAEAAGEKPAGEEAAAPEPVEDGDMIKGTGVWAHDNTQPINYNLLLNRFFTLLHKQHPDLASSGSKSYKIPPPQCLREGNKKTIFANIAEICKRMKRTDEHVTQVYYLIPPQRATTANLVSFSLRNSERVVVSTAADAW